MKREKTNGFIGLKTQGGVGQSKEKRENKWISRAKNRGQGGQPKEKREHEWISRG